MNETKRSHSRPAPQASGGLPLGMTLLTIALILVSVLCLRWLLFSIHSDATVRKQLNTPTGIAQAEKTGKVDFASKLEIYANNSASDALSELVYIKKIYKIPENDLVAPKPDESKYGVTDDPDEVQAVVDAASELLEGRELIWNKNIVRMENTDMRYYRDDTILAITWKEGIGGGAVTFAEVVIADGSQLRRALSGNSFGSGIRMKATEMAAAANAVIGINGDFYDNRQIGLSVYQRQICRNRGVALDSCFFTASGDMLMTHHGELVTDEDVQRYIEKNDVVFAISFGPILVENGELQTIYSYPVGEIESNYSRAAIAQKGERHYLLMTIGQEGNYSQRCQINMAAQIIYSKGVDSAYALDGGQTATMVMQNQTVNRVDWDEERTMSDIIYFATAMPEEG